MTWSDDRCYSPDGEIIGWIKKVRDMWHWKIYPHAHAVVKQEKEGSCSVKSQAINIVEENYV